VVMGYCKLTKNVVPLDLLDRADERMP
jgi:hypothetical protein